MDLLARIGETTYRIEVEAVEDSGPHAAADAAHDGSRPRRFAVTIEGTRHMADLAPVDGAGNYSLLLDGKPFDVGVLPEGRGVRVGDRALPIEIDEARHFRSRLAAASASHGHGREQVASPMPGVVVAIPVAPGDLVAPGQTVAVIEAMKMQNELVAEAAGRVSEVRARAGQVVDSGALLVVLDREAV